MTWADWTTQRRNDDRVTTEDRLTTVDGAQRRSLVTQTQRTVVQFPRVSVAIVTTVAKVTQGGRRKRQAGSFTCQSRNNELTSSTSTTTYVQFIRSPPQVPTTGFEREL